MNYITVRQSAGIRQMTLDELIYGFCTAPLYRNKDNTNTVTRTFSKSNIPEKYIPMYNIRSMIAYLKEFNEKWERLRNVPRNELYNTFHIPKKSGGLRRIDAPNPELMMALTDLKNILLETCGALYHTSAFAYIKGRSTLKALQRHQANNSRWFAKLDLSNFFGSTTMEFTMKMLSMIFPFSEIMSWEDGKVELTKAIELGFLDGGLPQGTPLSPSLTNIIMIPIDFEFNKKLREMETTFVCTRYADDFIISSRYDFQVKEIEDALVSVMRDFEAPYVIKREKTRYGSSSGQNWNLGLMINKDNQITVGHKRKREFKAMLTNYVMDRKNGTPWELGDIQTMEGLRSYYTSVEGQTIVDIINHINEKFGVNIMEMIHEDLHGPVVCDLKGLLT